MFSGLKKAVSAACGYQGEELSVLPETKQTEQRGLLAIKNTIQSIYCGQLAPISHQFKATAPPSKSEVHSNPLILFLGNHSSGKSSFINLLLGRDIQESSTAPVDDGFSIFTHGKPSKQTQECVQQSGEALVLNQKLPFQSLVHIKGKSFLHKVKLKYVDEKRLEDVMLVDSPGMVDGACHRDYDFKEAVEWFSTRADHIFFFFDPEKPGTTGETLSVLSYLLHQVDHKVSIVMNKADLFENVNDFIRTYGTLCWNLAKIIPVKDMPTVYTAHLPDRESLPGFENSLPILQRKIWNAPARHVDTLITELQKYTERLYMYCRLVSAIQEKLKAIRWKVYKWTGLFFVISCLLASQLLGSNDLILTACVLSFSMCILIMCLLPKFVAQQEDSIVLHLDAHFEVEFYHELRNGRENTERVWKGARLEVEKAIKQWGVFSFPTLSASTKDAIYDVTQNQMQNLLDQLRKVIAE